ncbi:arylsulfatase [Pseudarcicella hirudinis]|uniref:Arylsulfatase n=2 Tax=Pseudarcicella hirudinis TaxID=1079859 RepID=A0A1I5T3H7_9BACT|nr:sulfatase [Pseudarcicella hirudinis]SFP77590.1 arylsulfatase [Pseudarcicella hirudinis]
MKKIKVCIVLLTLAVLLITTGSSWKPSPNPQKPPNVVLIFMDDMGYGDLSCYGATGYKTPNLDQLALEGTRFTNFLAAQAVCSASRAALLTGTYPNRIGITGALMSWADNGINPEEETIPELLKEKGYTTGIFGKWHLGHHPEFLPLQNGFDEFYGIPYSNDMWPVEPDGKPATTGLKSRFPVLPLISGNDRVAEVRTHADQNKLTTTLTEKAVSFINRNKSKPFFLYFPHPMPHVPLGVSDKFKGKSGVGMYGDVMMEVDWSVGQVLKALKDNGLDRNTLVIFTSDNGPWLNYGNHAGSAGAFREGKGTSFEGGQREPCIIRWPGQVPAGRVCNKLLSNMDLLPTIAKVCGARLPKNRIDGIDWTELLKGNESITPRKTFYYYYRKNSLEGVRRDHWKLVFNHPGRTYAGYLPGDDGWPGPNTEDFAFPKALYDLRRDPGERYDVKEKYPEIVAELEKLAEEARQDLGDDLQNKPGTNLRKSGMHTEK